MRAGISRTDVAILGMLTVERMTGYDLKKFSDQSLAHFWHESYGNLYPRLKRLEAAGLVKGRKESREAAPDAIVYSITAAGRRRFLEWLAEDPQPDQVRSEFLLKVFFGAQADLDLCMTRIEEHRREQEAMLARYDALEDMIRGEPAERPEALYWLMALRRGRLLTEARLRWCDECTVMAEDSASVLPSRR